MTSEMNNKPFRMEYRGADAQSHESLRRVIYTLPGTMELLTDALNSSIELIFNLIEHNIPLTTLFNPDLVGMLADADRLKPWMTSSYSSTPSPSTSPSITPLKEENNKRIAKHTHN